MSKIEYKDLLDAGVHFGHLTRKWDPRMSPYIFMEKNGIHIIDLNKTLACLEEASNAIKQIVRSGKKIMFVATKKTSQRPRCCRSTTSQHALRDRKMVGWNVDQLRYYPQISKEDVFSREVDERRWLQKLG